MQSFARNFLFQLSIVKPENFKEINAWEEVLKFLKTKPEFRVSLLIWPNHCGNHDVNMIFRSAYFLDSAIYISINICIEQLKFSELVQFRFILFFWRLPKIDRANVTLIFENFVMNK